MKNFYSAFLVLVAMGLAFASCEKANTGKQEEQGGEILDITYTVYVPYFDNQLEYVNGEYTITDENGETSKITLSKENATNAKDINADFKNMRQSLATVIGITEEIKYFKLCTIHKTNTKQKPTISWTYKASGNADGKPFVCTTGVIATNNPSETAQYKDHNAYNYNNIIGTKEHIESFIKNLNNEKPQVSF